MSKRTKSVPYRISKISQKITILEERFSESTGKKRKQLHWKLYNKRKLLFKLGEMICG